MLCWNILRDREEAETATQDIFFKAWKALDSATVPADPARWITRIAVNTCLDRIRSQRWQFWRRRAKPEQEDGVLLLTPSREPGAERELFSRQIEARLTQALSGLSVRQRAVFTLKHYEDHTLEEIAEILALDLGSVKSHMSRALAKLRIELRDLYFTRSTP